MHKLNKSQLRTVRNSRTILEAMATQNRTGSSVAHKMVTYNETLKLTRLQVITSNLTLYAWLMGPRGKLVEEVTHVIDQRTFDKIARVCPEGLS